MEKTNTAKPVSTRRLCKHREGNYTSLQRPFSSDSLHLYKTSDQTARQRGRERERERERGREGERENARKRG